MAAATVADKLKDEWTKYLGMTLKSDAKKVTVSGSDLDYPKFAETVAKAFTTAVGSPAPSELGLRPQMAPARQKPVGSREAPSMFTEQPMAEVEQPTTEGNTFTVTLTEPETGSTSRGGNSEEDTAFEL